MSADSITIPQNQVKAFSGSQAAYITLKNFLDRITAILFATLLLPVLAIMALGIWLDSPGKPLFSQKRVGKNGRIFTAYKFRTMRADNDDSAYKAYLKKYIQQNSPYKVNSNGRPVFKLVDDPRVTRVGVFLRRYNLDELPQLINLIRGEMAFIGPRPDIPFSVQMYRDWHYQRLAVKPGITGLWQVAHRKALNFEDMVKLDINYIERQSPFMDLQILSLTIRTILEGDGS